jgi:hypothetical protein
LWGGHPARPIFHFIYIYLLINLHNEKTGIELTNPVLII